jgi:hypothetical protein
MTITGETLRPCSDGNTNIDAAGLLHAITSHQAVKLRIVLQRLRDGFDDQMQVGERHAVLLLILGAKGVRGAHIEQHDGVRVRRACRRQTRPSKRAV